jgi:hypothetical protein
MATIAADLTARVCIITAVWTLISYFVVMRNPSLPGQYILDLPLIPVAMGVVILISVLFDLRRFHIWNAQIGDFPKSGENS